MIFQPLHEYKTLSKFDYLTDNSNNGSEGGASSATLTPQNQSQQETTTGGQYNLLPYLYMLTKHLNGSLNLWKVCVDNIKSLYTVKLLANMIEGKASFNSLSFG